MEKITVNLKTVTPVFLGGALPNEKSEIRVPSIKAAMRFWYRAIDSDYNKKADPAQNESWEDKIFGSSSGGQAEFLLRAGGALEGRFSWDNKKYEKLNGINYFGYTLNLGDNNRRFIPPGKDIALTLTFRKQPEMKIRRSILASLWLLGHIGGLGSRSRRGFGTVSLQSWDCNWDEIDQLPIANGEATFEDWVEVFQSGLKIIKGWFPKKCEKDHTVICDNTRYYLVRDASRNKSFDSWEMALNQAGAIMQGFRLRWDLNDKQSDYHRVKSHLAYMDKNVQKVHTKIKPAKLTSAPKRVAFGLPLTFRYGSLKYQKTDKEGNPKFRKNGKPDYKTPTTTFQGVGDYNRSASPIHIRIIEVGDMCYPLFIRIDAPLLPEGESISEGNSRHSSYAIPDTSILDMFWENLLTLDGEEIRW